MQQNKPVRKKTALSEQRALAGKEVLSFGRTAITMMNPHLLFDTEENTVTKDKENVEVLNYFDSVFKSKLLSGYAAP